MNSALSWITPGVGSAISGTMTALGAVVAVFIAQRYFTSKVRDIKSALAETESAIENFRESALAKFSDLNATISALQESASKTQAAVYESQEVVEEASVEGVAQNNNPREEVKKYWLDIASHIEEIASSDAIDGRTRAKYGRIDRRSYYDLISALDADRRLNGFSASAKRAAEIWYSCRRATNIDSNIVNEMRNLHGIIHQIPKP